jgi:hypothetical protein
VHDVRTILPYGPWSPDCDPVECRLQLRGMATAAFMLVGPHDALWRTLRAGEDDAQAFVRAYDLIEALPSLTRRKLLATFSRVTWGWR